MRIGEIYSILDELSPFQSQESWDNSGLLVGDINANIKNIYSSLDLSSDIVKKLEPNSLIITHHPLIFQPLKRINFDSFSTKILRELIKRDISLISMHTNFDKTHLNRYVLTDILGFEVDSQNEFILNFEVNMSFDELLAIIKTQFALETTNIIKNKHFIKKASLITGSGGSLIKHIKSDCLLSGDIKYHDAMEAIERGLSVIDIGHFESEKFFPEVIKNELKKKQIEVIIVDSKNPFCRS